MSTNYYFRNVNRFDEIQKEEVILNSKIEKVIELVKDITEEDDVIWKIKNELESNSGIQYNSDIHIGQSVRGWMALLCEQPEYYNTVEQMKKFYENNKDQYIIVNEYSREITWDELVNELLSERGKERGHQKFDNYYWQQGEFS